MQQEKKYIPFEQIKITDRQWPDKTITKAPVWCSVDLRDGNQALVTPMGIPEKIRFFHTLVDCGFKEIEVGFPSASETEYEILRTLIEGGHIPDDVTVQVLVQAREELIRKPLRRYAVLRMLLSIFTTPHQHCSVKLFLARIWTVSPILLYRARALSAI